MASRKSRREARQSSGPCSSSWRLRRKLESKQVSRRPSLRKAKELTEVVMNKGRTARGRRDGESGNFSPIRRRGRTLTFPIGPTALRKH